MRYFIPAVHIQNSLKTPIMKDLNGLDVMNDGMLSIRHRHRAVLICIWRCKRPFGCV